MTTSSGIPSFVGAASGAGLFRPSACGQLGAQRFLSPRSPPRMALAPPPPKPPVPDFAPPSPAPEPWCDALVGRQALETVLSTSGDAFVVVIFVAQWCRTCKTLLSKVQRLSLAHPEIRFVTVDFVKDENKTLCGALNVKLLPTFHFYRNANDGLDHMAQFTAGPFGIKRLIERLAEFDIIVNPDVVGK